jgi:uncharacterized protein YkwD
MRKAPLLGLSAFAIVTVALIGVLGDDNPPDPVVEARRPARVEVATTRVEPTTTTTVPTVPAEPTRQVDTEALAASEWHLVTTTIAVPPPSDATAQAPSQSPSPPTTAPRSVSAPTTAPATTTTEPPTTTTAPTTSQAGPNGDFESQFASEINGYRSENGLSALSRDGSLDSRARSWAESMADNGDLSHSNLSSLLPPWSAAGENVGVGGTVKSLFGALVDSSGHRANMLGDYTHFGIGVWVDSGGRIWTAHVFTR